MGRVLTDLVEQGRFQIVTSGFKHGFDMSWDLLRQNLVWRQGSLAHRTYLLRTSNSGEDLFSVGHGLLLAPKVYRLNEVGNGCFHSPTKMFFDARGGKFQCKLPQLRDTGIIGFDTTSFVWKLELAVFLVRDTEDFEAAIVGNYRFISLIGLFDDILVAHLHQSSLLPVRW